MSPRVMAKQQPALGLGVQGGVWTKADCGHEELIRRDCTAGKGWCRWRIFVYRVLLYSWLGAWLGGGDNAEAKGAELIDMVLI